MEFLNGPTRTQDRRYRADALRLASVADGEVVKGHAQWRHTELKSRVDATRPSVVEGADAAVSTWVAGERNCISGQDLTEEAGNLHVDLARDATEEELNAWGKFKVATAKLLWILGGRSPG